MATKTKTGRTAKRVNADEVADRVVRLIEARTILPGDRLREQDLADRFGVSRGPVREALRILEARSMVHIEPMRGATVTRLTDAEALDAIAASSALFGLACKLAAERREAKDLAEMRRRLTELQSMPEAATLPREFFQQTLRIGRAVSSAARTPRIARMIVDVRFGAPDYFGPLCYTSEAQRRLSIENWNRLLDAIEAQDGAAADQLGRKIHDDAVRGAMQVIA